jgi:hypothetical protein
MQIENLHTQTKLQHVNMKQMQNEHNNQRSNKCMHMVGFHFSHNKHFKL